MKWIAFKEKEPCFAARLLLWNTKTQRVTMGHFLAPHSRFRGSMIYDSDQDVYGDLEEYTHWMELPKGPPEKRVFVFGSNEKGIHGAGAALFARQNHGAILGQGVGLQGNSYGIPTKDRQLKTLPLGSIEKYVKEFLSFASEHPEMIFDVTRVGTGLAGYSDADISPMFAKAGKNVNLPEGWRKGQND